MSLSSNVIGRWKIGGLQTPEEMVSQEPLLVQISCTSLKGMSPKIIFCKLEELKHTDLSFSITVVLPTV